MLEADEVIVDLEVGEVETGDQMERVDGGLESPFEVGEQRLQCGFPGSAVEAAHGDVDRVDGPAAQHLQQFVADLLHPQAFLDGLTVIGGQADAALVAQEVGGMQQVNVQRVAFDPLATVEQPPELADLGRDRHAQCLLEGVAGSSSDRPPGRCRRSAR